MKKNSVPKVVLFKKIARLSYLLMHSICYRVCFLNEENPTSDIYIARKGRCTFNILSTNYKYSLIIPQNLTSSSFLTVSCNVGPKPYKSIFHATLD